LKKNLRERPTEGELPWAGEKRKKRTHVEQTIEHEKKRNGSKSDPEKKKTKGRRTERGGRLRSPKKRGQRERGRGR